MEERYSVARPYASAAFKQAQEEDKIETWREMMTFLASVTADPTMRAVIGDPRVSRQRLAELLLSVCGGRLSKTGENFVRVLAEQRRLDVVAEIRELFEEQVAEFLGREPVEVISAYPLNPKYEQMITGAMAKRLGRAVDLTTRIDKSLIGGVIVRAGDVVIDGSLRGRLTQLGIELS